jgi:predicted glycoside hydrolase/deacetylase ChbG (UPF0249 family)
MHRHSQHKTSLRLLLVVLAVAVWSAILITGSIPISIAQSGGGQPASERTTAERLGYPRDTKLLMVHADDLGMARSVNAASIRGLESGLVTSASIMVPCPWFAEIAQYARAHPQADLGLHLTLTSEWKFYRWGPVVSKNQVSSLIDKQGYLYSLAEDAAAHANISEVETEIRAQIDRARAFGIEPTHLDSHMRTLYTNQALLDTFLKVSRDYKIPIMFAKEWLGREVPRSSIKPGEVLIDHTVTAGPDITADRWEDFYIKTVKSLQPGVTEVIIHLAYDDEEMRAATIDHPDWGAAWRQRDFNFFTSDKFRRLLEENKVKLVTYRELGKLMKE